MLEPIEQSLIAAGVLLDHAPDDVRGRWLPRVADGGALVTLAYQERAARYRLDACSATAEARAGGWSLTGAKSVVPAGDVADAYLVPALAEGRQAMFLVERGAGGCPRAAISRRTAAARPRWPSRHPSRCSRARAWRRSNSRSTSASPRCAQAVGAMEKTLALTVDYMNTQAVRRADREFQALRHRAWPT